MKTQLTLQLEPVKHFAKEPRKTSNGNELQRIYQRYIRMGFDEREARFKAMTHHAYKL